MTVGFLSLTCVLQAMANSLTDDEATTYSNMGSTFGFGSANMADTMTDEEKLKYAYKERETKAQYLIDSQRQLEASHKRREIRHQQSLIFIAMQKLNGKTPVYGEEKKDLEQIIKNANAKIKKLEKEEQGILNADRSASINKMRDALTSSYSNIREHEQSLKAKKSRHRNLDNDSVSATKSSSFFDYGNDNGSKPVNDNTYNPYGDTVLNQDAANTVDNVLKDLKRKGVIDND